MGAQFSKFALTAALALALAFTLTSCGQHSWDDWEDVIFGKSSSSAEDTDLDTDTDTDTDTNKDEDEQEEEQEDDYDYSSSSLKPSSSSSKPSSSSLALSSSSSTPNSSSSANVSSSSSKPSSSSLALSSSSLKSSSSSSAKVSSSSSRDHVPPCPDAATTPVNAEGVGSLECGGQTYKTVKIGGQVWMAENLNYNAEGSKCGGTEGELEDENTENCDKYGRLYNWYAATDVCPSGWHLPHDGDWNVLMKFVNPSCSDNSDCAGAGTKLKAADGWSIKGNGTDNFGFAALPGGVGHSDGGFYNSGFYGDWWSSSENNANIAYGRGVYLNINDFRRVSIDKSYYLFSVRCVAD